MEIMLYPILMALPFLIKDTVLNKLLVLKNQQVRRLEGQVRKGERLYSQIMFIRPDLCIKDLPEYKFFKDLILETLELAKMYGAPFKKPIDLIKISLLKDLERQRKSSSLKFSAVANFFMASIITWLFAFYTAAVLSLELSTWIITLMGLWQIIGFLTYLILVSKLESKLLAPFDRVFNCLYTIQSLSHVGLCVNEVISKSSLVSLYDIQVKKLQNHLSRLEYILEERKVQGSSILNELQIFIEQTWELFEHQAKLLEKLMVVIKFLWLCIFFFSTYLVVVFILLNQMNIS